MSKWQAGVIERKYEKKYSKDKNVKENRRAGKGTRTERRGGDRGEWASD